MLKNISNLGKTLNKADQKLITGGQLPGGIGEDCLPTCGFQQCLNNHGRCVHATFDEWQICSWNDILNC